MPALVNISLQVNIHSIKNSKSNFSNLLRLQQLSLNFAATLPSDTPLSLSVCYGLARAEAGRAIDAGNAGELRGSGFCSGLYFGLISDNADDIWWGCSIDFSDYCPQLAFLQSSPSQLVGPKRS